LSRVVILLTDGVNNSGEVPPIKAAEIAQTYGIRVYTIGVGSIGTAPYPVMTPYGVQMQQMKVEIDEDMMRKIAEMTGGQYFRAISNTKLLDIYKEINQMEKAKVEVDSLTHLKEEFLPYAMIALIFLLLDIMLRLTILRRLP
jgi:Ca-activated chloride channel family protein